MSDTHTDTDPSTDTDETSESDDEDTGARVRRYANYAILVVLGLLAFVAVVRLYLSVSNAIGTWVTREYRSLFQAAFNLVVLLAAGVGISYQLRRLYG
ncbi:hypothetical protein EI982_16670 [Haloplanus rallus]|jgi:uncharacterized membrane protein|uniref:DUF8060 domain-containing protein n=1 Tax=Haloplanus rallus TaxID=1816183 RepID=A0A6B9F762_9EURY|nr:MULTISPECIES: hypothetical protein [Haloplanus]QGX96296.1 hypothetical protein EI982_16670 [Haloplanus rallus]